MKLNAMFTKQAASDLYNRCLHQLLVFHQNVQGSVSSLNISLVQVSLLDALQSGSYAEHQPSCVTF